LIKGKFAAGFKTQWAENSALNGYKLVGLTFQNSSQSSDCIPYVQDDQLTLLLGDS